MSGGFEAVTVVGLIGSIISIVQGVRQVYGAASNQQGLPKAFHDAGTRLPIFQNILESAQGQIEAGDADEEFRRNVVHIIEQCYEKSEKVEMLFRSVVSADGAPKRLKYLAAFKSLGKGNQVEVLMKGMLEDVQLLAIDHGMADVTENQRRELAQAIQELAALSPSLSDSAVGASNPAPYHSGSGDQHNSFGGGSAYHARHITIGSNVDPPHEKGQACLRAMFQALRTDPRDDRNRLVDRKGRRVEGTYLLWISGGPGKGKTMLSIYLAEYLRKLSQEDLTKRSQNAEFLEFFCDNKDETRNTASSILCGLLYQLLQLRSELFIHILPAFKIQEKSLFTNSSFETLWKIFRNMICDPNSGTVYCVLDGLDECDEGSLKPLLRRLKTLFSKSASDVSPHGLKIIVVGRDLPDFIPELLSNFPRIRLDPDEALRVNTDIQRFIDAKASDLATLRNYPAFLRDHVKHVFEDRAKGTFLWVGIVANELRKYGATEVSKALDDFPPGLDDLYARMLRQVDVSRQKIVIKILHWVVTAVRPLTLSELGAALESDIRTPAGFSPTDTMRDNVSCCGHFLTITEEPLGREDFSTEEELSPEEEFSGEEEVVNLIHQSAKDFLLSKFVYSSPKLEAFHVKEAAANLEVATTCFNYLHNGALQNGMINLRSGGSHLETFPFLSYAVLHWHEHAKFLSYKEAIFNLSLPFYDKHSRVRKAWLDTYFSVKYAYDKLDSSKLLHVASYFNIIPLAQNILRPKNVFKNLTQSFDVNRNDSSKRAALHIAAGRGNEAMVQLLLQKRANMRVTDIFGWTPLSYAVHNGNETLVRIFLEKGANIEAKDQDGDTALIRAVSWDREAVVRLLLEKGANIEAKNQDGDTALIVAVCFSDIALTRLLLESGADIEAKDRDGKTALNYATNKGHEGIVQLLTNHQNSS